MTEYDLETKKALRRVSLLEYGFGPETLRGRKICPACGRGNGAYRTDCISCGAALPALGIAPADMEQALRASVRPQFVEMNLAALRLGAQAQKKADEKGETDHD